jgi:hypothetical protein
MVRAVVPGLFYALGKVPGMDWAKSASEAISGFQDKINNTLTGSTATLLESGVKGAVKGYEEGGVLGAIAGGAKGAAKNWTEPYEQARARYLEEHPEAAGSPDDSKFEAMLAEFKKMAALMGEVADNTGATAKGMDNLGGSPGSSKPLTYAQMGVSNIWDIIEAGAR